MKEEAEAEVQYYYDSTADQWWQYDEQQHCWVPWKETDAITAEQDEEATESNDKFAARGEGATDAERDSPAFENHKAETDAATGVEDSNAFTNAGENEASVQEELQPHIEENDHTSSRSTGGVQGRNSRKDENKEGAICNAGATKLPPSSHHLQTQQQLEQEHYSTSLEECSKREALGEQGDEDNNAARATATEEEGQTTELVNASSKDRETEREEDADPELDRVRSALESLAITPCLDRALPGFARTRGDAADESGKFHAAAVSHAASLNIENLGSDSRGSLSLFSEGGAAASEQQQQQDKKNLGSDGSDLSDLPEPPQVDNAPFVKRSTRMLTFKDKGGLAGCLQEAAQQRLSLIEEAGGIIPGIEEYREEAWKQRARELASQSHARTKQRWVDAARRVSAEAASHQAENEKIQHLSDLVKHMRRRRSADTQNSTVVRAAADAPSSSLEDVAGPASLLLKPSVDLREERRRSSGFAGGQQGYVRFADPTFRDPSHQLQMQSLLTQQSKKKTSQ